MRSDEVVEAKMCCSSAPNGGRGSAVNLRSAVERVLRPLQAPALAVFCFFIGLLLSFIRMAVVDDWRRDTAGRPEGVGVAGRRWRGLFRGKTQS